MKLLEKIRMEKPNYKSKNTERKHLNNKRKNQFLRWKKQYFLRQSLKIVER